jgi:hypothetical protein
MEVLHITPSENINSIMRNKIVRCKPILSQFDEVMSDEYGSDYDKDKGLVFGFPESIYNRDKIIKDFAYWKVWGDVRNRFLDKYDYNEFVKIQEEGTKVFSHIKLKSTYFSILLLDVEYEPFFDRYKHIQNADMGPYWADMETRYEHDDKPLVLMNYDVEINNIKRVIGTVQSIVSKENKINTLLQI